MARNVQVRIVDLEVGDTIVAPGGGTFVFASHTTSLNGYQMLSDAGGRVLVFPTGSTVTITVP